MEVKGEIEEDSSRNLLQSFGGEISSDAPSEVAGGGYTCEVDLNLGLSLNGCFGVEIEPKEKRLSTRSSSISSFSLFPIEQNVPLSRNCSLPAETEEVRRKRKEMESFKRMEAKRKRSEKKAVKDRKDENFDDDSSNLQGSCLSSVSDLESKPKQGIILSASNQTNQKVLTTVKRKREGDGASRKKSCGINGMKESERNMVEKMPSVSTKGDGPEGRRIHGFLYRYGKGEVRIVCVCHGQFLTPAEFVKHARGGDVAHPLRHIVVNSTPALL